MISCSYISLATTYCTLCSGQLFHYHDPKHILILETTHRVNKVYLTMQQSNNI